MEFLIIILITITISQYAILFIGTIIESLEDLEIETKQDFYTWLIPIYGLINFLKKKINKQLE